MQNVGPGFSDLASAGAKLSPVKIKCRDPQDESASPPLCGKTDGGGHQTETKGVLAAQCASCLTGRLGGWAYTAMGGERGVLMAKPPMSAGPDSISAVLFPFPSRTGLDCSQGLG